MKTDQSDSQRKSNSATVFGTRSFPLCGSSKRTQECIASDPPAEYLQFSRLLDEWGTDIFTRKSFFTYCRCGSCGLLYCSTYPGDDQLARLYSAMKPNMSDLPEESLCRTQAEYASCALDAKPPAGDVIEVGPDRGLLARALIRNRAFEKFWFIEPNVEVHTALRSAVEPHAIDVATDLNGFGHIPDRTASLAIMVHVLDHLTDPMHHLHEIRRCLKPDGVLTIVVHNEQSLLVRLFGSNHPIFCPYHPQLFNPDTLRRMLMAAGFSDVRIRRTRNHYPLGYLLKNAVFRMGFSATAVPILPSAIVPLPLGNIQAVARRR